jgi:hypothetical protein
MNENFSSFKAVLSQFVKEANISRPPVTACFAVAGPVTNNSVSFTNRKEWAIVGEDIERSFKIRRVKLVNDFVAVGYGLLTLRDDVDCVTLNVSQPFLKPPASHKTTLKCSFLSQFLHYNLSSRTNHILITYVFLETVCSESPWCACRMHWCGDRPRRVLPCNGPWKSLCLLSYRRRPHGIRPKIRGE